MSLLDELYNGNIRPNEKYIIRNSAYSIMLDDMTKDYEELYSKLCKSDKEILDQIEKLENNLTAISDKESFIEGFILGIQLMQEVRNYKSKNFEKIGK